MHQQPAQAPFLPKSASRSGQRSAVAGRTLTSAIVELIATPIHPDLDWLEDIVNATGEDVKQGADALRESLPCYFNY